MSDPEWLSADSRERLRRELESREGEGRTAIARRLSDASTDGVTGGGYRAALEEQGENERRIRRLRTWLDQSADGPPPEPTDPHVVAEGRVVTVRLHTRVGVEEETFLLGSHAAEVADFEAYSPDSPIGAAVLGRRVGESATYTAAGREITVEVVEVAAWHQSR